MVRVVQVVLTLVEPSVHHHGVDDGPSGDENEAVRHNELDVVRAPALDQCVPLEVGLPVVVNTHEHREARRDYLRQPQLSYHEESRQDLVQDIKFKCLG